MCLKIDDPGVLEMFCLGFKEKWHQLQAHFIQIQDQSKAFPRHNKGNDRVDVYNYIMDTLMIFYWDTTKSIEKFTLMHGF